MTITPEIVAKLIYCIHNLRYWELQYNEDLSVEVRRCVKLWQKRADELLEQLGATEFIDLKTLIEEL
ncbi:MAG: hypothetical protein AABY22_32575, partial [Nanoarchaeota archaeon]